MSARRRAWKEARCAMWHTSCWGRARGVTRWGFRVGGLGSNGSVGGATRRRSWQAVAGVRTPGDWPAYRRAPNSYECLMATRADAPQLKRGLRDGGFHEHEALGCVISRERSPRLVGSVVSALRGGGRRALSRSLRFVSAPESGAQVARGAGVAAATMSDLRGAPRRSAATRRQVERPPGRMCLGCIPAAASWSALRPYGVSLSGVVR